MIGRLPDGLCNFNEFLRYVEKQPATYNPSFNDCRGGNLSSFNPNVEWVGPRLHTRGFFNHGPKLHVELMKPGVQQPEPDDFYQLIADDFEECRTETDLDGNLIFPDDHEDMKAAKAALEMGFEARREDQIGGFDAHLAHERAVDRARETLTPVPRD